MHRHHAAVRIAATITTALAILAGATTAHAVDYGSGQLGDWPSWSHSDQTDTTHPTGTVSWDTATTGIIGDSITARCYPRAVTRYTAAGQTLAVNYWSGRPITPAVDWLIARINAGQPIPARIIMAAGTNDIFNPPVVQAQVARLKAALPTTTQLYVVDVTASRWGTSYPTATQVSDMRNSSWVNGQMRAVLPDAQVIGWAAQIAAVPGRSIPIAYYLEDGVHPWAAAGSGHGDGCDLWAFTLVGKTNPAKRK